MDAEIGVIGGSGFYSMLKKPKLIDARNAYGNPSESIAIGRLGPRSVAFLARHSKRHTIPPHRVPYRANMQAFSDLGIKRVIATAAVGSLKEEYAPGDLLFFDQFVNMTHGRSDTFFDEDYVVHVSAADPYCEELRGIAIKEAKRMRIKYHSSGTVVVVNGPRFSTRAESRYYGKQGFDVINMTQYPEAILAKEREMCYLGIGLVTDYDVGLEGRADIKKVSARDVSDNFSKGVTTMKELVERIIKAAPGKRSCACSKSLENSVQTQK